MSDQSAPLPLRYVDDAASLEEAIAACRRVPVVSIDTEFMRSSTYYPIVGLIQLYDGEHCYLIDPVALEDISPVGELLADEGVLKVFHACSEDLEVFQYCLGTLPRPMFDTQIAAAAAGIGFSLGYQNLVEQVLSVDLPKGETRSDWLQRPLTTQQIDYAALDVIYLYQLHDHLAGLLGAEKVDWVMEECREMLEDIMITMAPERMYLRIKAAWRLDRQEMNVLKELCAWRETRARMQDLPRNRVIDEKALMTLARKDITDIGELRSEGAMTARQIRKFGDELLMLVARARQTPEDECPAPMPRPLGGAEKKLMNKLRPVVEQRAKALGMSPELLARKKHLEELVRSRDGEGVYHLPQSLAGWRREPIGEPLVDFLNNLDNSNNGQGAAG